MLLAASSVAFSATECPLIRPPALTAAQVDAVVAAKVAEQVHRPIAPNDLGKTLKELDGARNGIMAYAFFVLSVGETLGFDAAAAFHADAQARGGKHPFETLSVASFQEISRQQYFLGRDAPAPAAVEDAQYKLQRIYVETPRPAKGWVLARCGSDYIVFQRGSASSQGSTTAGARLVSLQPYKGTEAMLGDARNAATAMTPASIVRKSIDASIVEGTNVPCVDLRILGAVAEQPYAMHARFCYSAKDSTLGYAALYAQHGRTDLETTAAEAARFIAGASPK
jgi:hypothetical protein